MFASEISRLGPNKFLIFWVPNHMYMRTCPKPRLKQYREILNLGSQSATLCLQMASRHQLTGLPRCSLVCCKVQSMFAWLHGSASHWLDGITVGCIQSSRSTSLKAILWVVASVPTEIQNKTCNHEIKHGTQRRVISYPVLGTPWGFRIGSADWEDM